MSFVNCAMPYIQAVFYASTILVSWKSFFLAKERWKSFEVKTNRKALMYSILHFFDPPTGSSFPADQRILSQLIECNFTFSEFWDFCESHHNKRFREMGERNGKLIHGAPKDFLQRSQKTLSEQWRELGGKF